MKQPFPSHTVSKGCHCWFLLLSLHVGRLPQKNGSGLSSFQLRQLWLTPGAPGSPSGCSKVLEAEGWCSAGTWGWICLTCPGYTELQGQGCCSRGPGTRKCSSPEGLFEGEVIPCVSSPVTPRAGLSMESSWPFAVIQAFLELSCSHQVTIPACQSPVFN